MSTKKVLFIDDGDISAIRDRLKRNLRRDGITLIDNFLSLSHDNFKKEDPKNRGQYILDFEKIKNELMENHFGENYNLVACDYYYAGDPIDGSKILKWLKNTSRDARVRIRKSKFVLYSSQGEKVVEMTNTVDELIKLIRLRLDGFFRREDLARDLTRLLKLENTPYRFIEKIINELEAYPDFEFKSVYPAFKGKTLSEIAHEIDVESYHGIRFQDNLIELTFSHMIDLNNEEAEE